MGEPDSRVTEGLHSHEQGNILIDVGELLLAVEIGDHGGEYRPDAAHAHAVPHYEQDDVEQGMGQEDAGQRQRIAQEQQLRGEQRSGAVTDPAPCVLAHGPEQRGQAHEPHRHIRTHAGIHKAGLELAEHAPHGHQADAERYADDPHLAAGHQLPPIHGNHLFLFPCRCERVRRHAVDGQADIFGRIADNPPAKGKKQEGEAAEYRKRP